MNEQNQSMYDQMISTYKETDSVQQTAILLGVSRNTVQRVLLTEEIWESERSRAVAELLAKGCSAQEIADQLYLSLKCVQNYMPYSKGMNNGIMTENAKKSREKRDRMKKALKNQVGNKPNQNIPENGMKSVMSKELLEDMMNRLPYEDIGEWIRKEDRPEKAAKKYLPSVFKLKLELVDYYGDDLEWYNDELTVLRKYAKVQNGFTREVLVPTSMSLNALNYMIQKLYGWQNSHLHSFSLPKGVFNAVTDGSNIEQWKNLCGVLFRYPEEEDGDRYSGDDYDGTISFKTWLKNKYSGTELPFCVSDTYIENQRMIAADETMWNKLAAQGVASLEQLEFAMDLGGPCDTILERLTLGEILSTSDQISDMTSWIALTAEEIEAKQKLIEQCKETQIGYLSLIEELARLRSHRMTLEKMDLFMHRGSYLYDIPKTRVEQIYKEGTKTVHYMESNLKQIFSALEPQITPLTDTLLYSYDYGDGWCVRVTCTEGYYINDSWDHPNEQGYVLMIADDKKAAEDWDFFACSSDAKITGDYAELLRNTLYKKTPMCLFAEGLCLLDDVGGVYGFVDMLRTIHGGDPAEAGEMRKWAREMGWTGRMSKPEKML